MQQPAITDPDELALLIAQQYLKDQGLDNAVKATEKQDGRLYVDSKLPRGSMLLELVYSMLEQEALADEGAREAMRAKSEEDALLSASAASALPKRLERSIDGVHGAVVTSVKLAGDSIVTGTGNGQVRRISLDGQVAWTAQAAPTGVLALALLPAQKAGAEEGVLAVAMDGSVALHSAASGKLLAGCSPHRKYVVAAAVTASGRMITGSWDGTVCVLQAPTSLNATSSGGSGDELKVLATQSYESGIAAVALLPDGKTAVVGLKSSCYLRLYDTELLQEAGRVNLNDFEWDQRLSFSAATLDLSPDGSFLLISTDGPRILVLRVRDWSKAKLLYGLPTAAQFHQYAACWLGSTHIAAAAAGGTVFVFRLSDAKVVEKVVAHPGSNVRVLASNAAGTQMITGSFDKTVKVFSSVAAAAVG